MASPTQIEFLKVLACMAWADEELTRSEVNLIGRLMQEFQLSSEDRMQVEMYLDEKDDLLHISRKQRQRRSIASWQQKLSPIDSITSFLRSMTSQKP